MYPRGNKNAASSRCNDITGLIDGVRGHRRLKTASTSDRDRKRGRVAIIGNDIHDNNARRRRTRRTGSTRATWRDSIGPVEAHFNRIVGNGIGVNNDLDQPDLIDATNNWWGCNAGPGALNSAGNPGCDKITGATAFGVDPGLVDADPWLVLSITAEEESAGPERRQVEDRRRPAQQLRRRRVRRAGGAGSPHHLRDDARHLEPADRHDAPRQRVQRAHLRGDRWHGERVGDARQPDRHNACRDPGAAPAASSGSDGRHGRCRAYGRRRAYGPRSGPARAEWSQRVPRA